MRQHASRRTRVGELEDTKLTARAALASMLILCSRTIDGPWLILRGQRLSMLARAVYAVDFMSSSSDTFSFVRGDLRCRGRRRKRNFARPARAVDLIEARLQDTTIQRFPRSSTRSLRTSCLQQALSHSFEQGRMMQYT